MPLRRLLAACLVAACSPATNDAEQPAGDGSDGDEFAEEAPDGDEPAEEGAADWIPDACTVLDPQRPTCAESAGCTAQCTEPECGDGIVSVLNDEECDEGNGTPFESCVRCRRVESWMRPYTMFAVTPEGEVYAADADEVARLDSAGMDEWRESSQLDGEIFAIAASAGGVSALSEGSACHMQRWSSAGDAQWIPLQFSPDTFCRDQRVAVGLDDFSLVIGWSWVQVVSPQGALENRYDIAPLTPGDARVDSAGRVEFTGHSWQDFQVYRHTFSASGGDTYVSARSDAYVLTEHESYLPSKDVAYTTFGPERGVTTLWQHRGAPWVDVFSDVAAQRWPRVVLEGEGPRAIAPLADGHYIVALGDSYRTQLFELDRTGWAVRSLELYDIRDVYQMAALPDGRVILAASTLGDRFVGALPFRQLATDHARLNDGERCRADRDCRSNLCPEPGADRERTCQPSGLDEGAACEEHDSCASGLCLQQECVPTGIPTGAACSDHRQCSSGLCREDECQEGVLGPGEPCTQPVQCASHQCFDQVCS